MRFNLIFSMEYVHFRYAYVSWELPKPIDYISRKDGLLRAYSLFHLRFLSLNRDRLGEHERTSRLRELLRKAASASIKCIISFDLVSRAREIAVKSTLVPMRIIMKR